MAKNAIIITRFFMFQKQHETERKLKHSNIQTKKDRIVYLQDEVTSKKMAKLKRDCRYLFHLERYEYGDE